uniref:F5/8 type C domain-containing protein n=1 Tax=Cyprinodon variegatus TaxID=28743 RepID=A0A3Q2DM23_CYPVA
MLGEGKWQPSLFPLFLPAVVPPVCGSGPRRCGVQRCGREDPRGEQQRHSSLRGNTGEQCHFHWVRNTDVTGNPPLPPPVRFHLSLLFLFFQRNFSGGVADTQLSSSSVWDWNTTAGQPRVWRESGARLKKAGLPWAPSHSDQQQWLQVDLKREKRITGSNLSEYRYFVSAYQVLYSKDGKVWHFYKNTNSTQDKGNTNYADKVRNNFIPPIEARFVRIKPSSWHQRIALKLELLGKCEKIK